AHRQDRQRGQAPGEHCGHALLQPRAHDAAAGSHPTRGDGARGERGGGGR
ncbi:unnamed protein product, partial [Heterosigma akashiwo]